jgi:hypothetical protein
MTKSGVTKSGVVQQGLARLRGPASRIERCGK